MSCTFGVRSSTDGRTFATELSDVREANNQNDDDLRSAAAMRFGSTVVGATTVMMTNSRPAQDR